MFFEKGQTKIADQKLSNKAAMVLHDLNFDWFYTNLSNEGLRMKLKESFFKYPSSAGSSYLAGMSQIRKQVARNAKTTSEQTTVKQNSPKH